MAPIWNQEFLKTKHHYQRYKSVNNPSGLDDLSLRVLERDLSVQYKRRIKIGPDGFPKVYCAVDPASFERLCTETPLPAIAPPRIKKVTLEELIGTPASKTIPSIRIV